MNTSLQLEQLVGSGLDEGHRSSVELTEPGDVELFDEGERLLDDGL